MHVYIFSEILLANNLLFVHLIQDIREGKGVSEFFSLNVDKIFCRTQINNTTYAYLATKTSHEVLKSV